MDTWIELRNVGKWYSSGVPILEQIDLIIRRGQCLAIRGRNGSGKSTLLKIIAGIAKPSSGAVRRAPNLAVGYAPEQFPKVRFGAEDYLTHLGRMRRMPRRELNRRIRELMDLFRMHSTAPITHFSKGMTQKVNLMQAVLARPDVIVLDEPLSGLDAASQEEFVRLILRFKQEGAAIIMTGHEPGFADAWADRTMVLEHGRLREMPVKEPETISRDEPSAWISDQWGVN